jgi:hypothetical protein
MIKTWPTKDPNAKLRYYFDWSGFCTGEGSNVASYALSADSPPDAALLLTDDSRSGNIVMVWIAGGTVDVTYTIRCRVTLVDGSIEDESRSLTIAAH